MADPNQDLHLEIAHVLFIDVVGYSKLLTDDQREIQQQLNQVVRGTSQFLAAEAEGKLVRLPTGDGMALVFHTNQAAPMRCAIEISEAAKSCPRLQLRMGIHSGPVSDVPDVNDRANVAGAGINIAQRVMSCGDAGHILLSKRVADDLAQYRQWQPHLHEIGECEVKHEAKLSVVNFYNDSVGNPNVPKKFRKLKAASRRNIGLIAALVVLIALGTVFWVSRHWSSGQNNLAAVIPEKSIAVLPFENLSEDKANSFFADGVQDEILSDLSRVAELKVISRTSVMQYKNVVTRNVREIAQQLGVAHVLEGSVQRTANRIRVSAQLIDARTDGHLWAEHYDRDLADVFAIQSEIAKAIVEQLQAKISPNERTAIEQKPTNDLVAYDLYLRAKELLHGISTSTDWEGDNRRAVDLLERAVTRDQNFALAQSLLYDWNLNLYDWVDRTPARLARAEAALKQLIRIAPEAGETYLARSTEYKRAGDFDRASEMLEGASKALPGSIEVLISLAQIERRRGHWNEAIGGYEKARELDPRGPNVPNGLCDLYNSLHEYAKSDQVADAAISAFPNGPGYFQAAKVENAPARGDVKQARTALATLPPGWDPSGYAALLRVKIAFADRNYPDVLQLLTTINKQNVIPELGVDILFIEALVARKQGDMARAHSVLMAMRASSEADLRNRPDDIDSLSRLGRIDAYLGRKEDALRESEKAVELKSISRDAVAGPICLTALAEVCTVTGDRDRAIRLLLEVARIPYGPSYGELLTPWWDDLRGDPRFEKIVAAAKAASK